MLLATVAAVILWFLVLLGVAFATRVRGVVPGPAAMDLGEEPPAVVDLLTSDWRVTPDAVPATLLDLAARDYVDLEQHGPGRTVCRLRRTSAEGLEAYERMVLDHVAGLAVDGVVPAEALTTGPQEQSTRWWRAFRQAVVADARERGLARDRWSAPVKAFLRAAALVPAGLGVLYANAAGGLDFGTIGAGLVIWVVLTSSIRLFGDQRDTPAGAEAAARWLGVRDYLGRNEVFPTLPPASVAIWDRYLGYGAALGVATAALRALPMGAEDDHRAWSAYGGRWRVVKVRYPRLGFTWGRRPPVAFLVGLATAGAGYVALRLMLGVRGWTEGQLDIDQAAGWVRTAATVLAVAALLVAAWGAWTMLRAVLDLVSKREVEGQVVRRRSYSRGNDRTDHFIAVDSGRSDRIKAWLVPGGVYARLREGGVARATVGPRLGHVFRLELVSAPGAPARVPVSSAAEAEEQLAPGGRGRAADPAAVAWVAGAAGVLADPGIEVDPAWVVTAEDAALALGEPVGPARPLIQQPSPVGRMRGCRYQAASGLGSVSCSLPPGIWSDCSSGSTGASATRTRVSATRPSCVATRSWSSRVRSPRRSASKATRSPTGSQPSGGWPRPPPADWPRPPLRGPTISAPACAVRRPHLGRRPGRADRFSDPSPAALIWCQRLRGSSSSKPRRARRARSAASRSAGEISSGSG